MAMTVQAISLNVLKLSLLIKVAMAIYKHWTDLNISSRHTRKSVLLFNYAYLYQISI